VIFRDEAEAMQEDLVELRRGVPRASETGLELPRPRGRVRTDPPTSARLDPAVPPDAAGVYDGLADRKVDALAEEATP
jgi:hypothetical protein